VIVVLCSRGECASVWPWAVLRIEMRQLSLFLCEAAAALYNMIGNNESAAPISRVDQDLRRLTNSAGMDHPPRRVRPCLQISTQNWNKGRTGEATAVINPF
jgi:hypothetical protein